MYDELKRKYEEKYKQVVAVMKILEIFVAHMKETQLKSINVIHTMGGRKVGDDEFYYLDDQELSDIES